MEVVKVEIKNEQDFLKVISQLRGKSNNVKYLILGLCCLEPNNMSSESIETFSAFEDMFFEEIKELEYLCGIIFNYLRENGNYRKN